MDKPTPSPSLSLPLSAIFWKSPIRNFTKQDIIDMAASLRIHGQIQPVICKPANAEGMCEGVCGHLRYEAAKHAGLGEMLVRVHKFEDEEEVLEWQLAENLHRKELSALERAQAYGKLADLRKKRFPEEQTVVKGIAMAVEELTGTKPAEKTVRKYLDISRKIGNKAKEISLPRPSEKASFPKISHLEQISRIEDEDKQAELLEKTATRGWTVQKLEQEVDRELGLKLEPPKPIDTGLVIACPECRETYTLIHVEEGSHRLQKIKGVFASK
jgi:ParB family chromosome partitioning protein